MAVRALVVGGTSGIGHAMACRIAAESSSSTVIISGRSKPQNMPHANMEFRPLDATSMGQIKRYTDAFKSAQGQKLDFLVYDSGHYDSCAKDRDAGGHRSQDGTALLRRGNS